MGRQVRIGFIGTGGIAGAHMRRLKEIPEARITAVCDIDAERAKAAAQPFGAHVFTQAGEIIEKGDIEALYICVPPFAHGDIEIQAARKGLHLFVEKPVNLYLADAKKAWTAIKKADVFTQSGYSMRYSASSVQLKKLLEGKDVGSAHASRWCGMPGTPWWRQYDKAGGQLVEMTTHQLDLLRWVMGEVATVSASYSFNRLLKDQPDVTVPDTQAVLLTFENGASATLSTSCAAGRGYKGGLDFVLRDAVISVGGPSGITVSPEDAYNVPAPPAESPSIDAAFVRAVASGQRDLLRSPFDDALKSMAVTLAANLSAAEGGRQIIMKDFLGDFSV